MKKMEMFYTDICSFKEDYVLVAGKKEQLTDELKNNMIGLYQHNFGFEGMITVENKDLFSSCEFTKPSLEEIMVHIER